MKKKIPTAPAGFDQERFFAGGHWFQKWELFDGVFTPGVNSIQKLCTDLRLPEDLTGKRVLDVGAWSGCLSFECERRGAREVVAVEPMDPAVTGFYKLRDAAGAAHTSLVRGSVYDLNPDKLGHFDIVLFCGVLYHLRYPLLAIDNIRRVCRGDVFVETVVSDAQVLVPGADGMHTVALEVVAPMLLHAPLWQFYRRDELHNDSSNWFGPNNTAVVQAFESAGFDMTVVKSFGRATFHGRVRPGLPEFLTLGCTEADYYDCVIRPVFGTDKASWSADQLAPVLVLGPEPPLEPEALQAAAARQAAADRRAAADRANGLGRWWGAAKRLGRKILTKADAGSAPDLRKAG